MTHREAALLRYIRGYQAAYDGASPSLDEMAAHLGCWKSAVHRSLAMLERSGRIWRRHSVARCIEVLGDGENRANTAEIPHSRNSIPLTHPDVITVPIYSMMAFPDQFARERAKQRAQQVEHGAVLHNSGGVTA